MTVLRKFIILAISVLAVSTIQVISAQPAPAAQPGAPAQPGPPGPPSFPPRAPEPVDNHRSIAPYFKPAVAGPKATDIDGFLQRWLLLEPVVKPNRSNAVFTDSYVRTALTTEYFPNQFTVVPKDGDKVTVAGQELAWHALDTPTFNAKVFRLAYGLNKPTYGVIFWAVTVINSPREIKNIRLAVGSNSASMWWLNGNEAVNIFGDRHMIVDDAVSKRITLNKGKNILRGAIINGPGLSDFCVRFIDENGVPVKDITVNLQ
jgi:hypothetical protein